MKKLVFEFLFQNKMLLSLSILATILCSILNVGVAYLIYIIIEIAQNANNSSDAIILTIFVVMYLLFLGGISYLEDNLKEKVIQNSISNLKKELIYKITNQNYKDFTKYSISEYQSLLMNDIQMIEDDLYYGLFSFLSYLISFIISLISMVYINSYVTLWFFLWRLL